MKYYIYISDTKVDMLFPQVPHDVKKKVSTELGFDLKVLSAKRKVESESDENRILRLETVVEFIRKYGKIGSVDEPGEYVEGTQPLRMLYPTYNDKYAAVYFAGHTDRTAFGLGGSLKHMIGAGFDPNPPIISRSVGYMMLYYLTKNPEISWTGDRLETGGLDLVVKAAQVEGGVYQNVEFLAKKLVFENFERRGIVWSSYEGSWTQILLASPLYLALAD